MLWTSLVSVIFYYITALSGATSGVIRRRSGRVTRGNRGLRPCAGPGLRAAAARSRAAASASRRA